MIQVELYLEQLILKLKQVFGTRLAFVGLQGSYLRGEAGENSDIDVMVLIHALKPDDLISYRTILISLGDTEKSCGFLCGTEDFSVWNPLEICHVLHSTKAYYGTLEEFVPPYTLEDHKKYVLLSVGNLYHALCHRFVHANEEKNIRKLHTHEKELFFILQGLYYWKTGIFPQNHAMLTQMMTEEDRNVYHIVAEEAKQEDYDFNAAFSTLFSFCQQTMKALKS
ncbi:MAG: nucleotidyltransferase domain-containing protein [Clostridia bacterium]|nr:nucleotidyltransferase domain-containing protein [Clostridia bacterium]